MLWSILLAMVYLNARLVALRCVPFTLIPIVLLPLQLCGDLFTELGKCTMQLTGKLYSNACATFLVFLDFSLASWQFWYDYFIYTSGGDVSVIGCFCRLVMLFDVFLLVMRDADLWDDFASWFARKSGRIGALALVFAQLIAGETGARVFVQFAR